MTYSESTTGRSRNPFSVLGLAPGASPEQIRAAYRRLAMQLHPDRNVRADGTVSPRAHEDFCTLTGALEGALAAATTAQVRAATVHFPVPRRSATTTVTPTRTVPAQRRPALVREGDPLLTLLTLPRHCGPAWSSVALETWALTLVPGARPLLGTAQDLAEAAGARTRDDFVLATVHALICLAMNGRTGRRASGIAPHVAGVLATLEDELPSSVVARLRSAVRRG